MALTAKTFNIANLFDGADGANYKVGQAVYVKNESGTYADIFRDEAGLIAITQDGADNVTNSKGEFTFFIDDGSYLLEVRGEQRSFFAGNIKTEFATVSEAANYKAVDKLLGMIVYIKERNDYFEVVLSSSLDGADLLNQFESNENQIYGFNLLVMEGQVNAASLGLNSSNLTERLPLINQLCQDKGWNLICNVSGVLTGKVRWMVGTHKVDFTGSIFTTDYRGSGAAWEFATDDRNILKPDGNASYDVIGFHLVASSYVQTNHNCDGISLGRQSDQLYGETRQVSLINPIVRGAFSYNVVFLNHTFINSIHNPTFKGGYNGNFRLLTQVNAGENINIHGGVIADAHNDSETGTNVIIGVNANADVYFNGTSIDYGDKQVVMYSGAIHGTIHMENNSAAPDVELIETNNQPITFNLTGGTIATGPLPSSSNPEPALGKSSRIVVNGSKINVCLTGIGNDLRDKPNTELVTVESGLPIISVTAPFYDANPLEPALISRYLNCLRNGGFENNNTQSWQLNGASGASIAASSTESYIGAYSLKFTGTGGASFSAAQQFSPSNKTKFVIRSQIKLTSYTSGQMEMLAIFRDWQGNQVGARTATVTPGAIGDWLLVSDSAPIPYSTHTIEIQIKANAFIGEAYVDDIVVNLI